MAYLHKVTSSHQLAQLAFSQLADKQIAAESGHFRLHHEFCQAHLFFLARPKSLGPLNRQASSVHKVKPKALFQRFFRCNAPLFAAFTGCGRTFSDSVALSLSDNSAYV